MWSWPAAFSRYWPARLFSFAWVYTGISGDEVITYHVEVGDIAAVVDVEADSLADACALSVGPGACAGRPWSSVHRSIEPGVEHFSSAVRDLLQKGFSIHRATISHCSKSQWAVEFHGAHMGNPGPTDVRLWTTPGNHRPIHVQLAAFY